MAEDYKLFDWDDEIEKESEFTLLPAGDYDFEITKFERGSYDGSDKIPPCKMALVTFRVTDGTDSTSILERYYLCSSMEWKLSELFKACGLKKSGEKVKMQWDKLAGSKGRCKVKINKYKDTENNRIDRLYAQGEASEGGGNPWED